MNKPSPASLQKILAQHAAWRRGEPSGLRAALSWAGLSGAGLIGADLIWADLRGADLRGADLSGAALIGADLSGADLSGADVIGAGLRGAKGLPEAPVIPHIDAAILAQINGHKFDMRTWRSECGTTLCRGAFAIKLAGPAGVKLEKKTTTYVAAYLIYVASRPGIPCPDFFASNEEALADLRACAERDPL